MSIKEILTKGKDFLGNLNDEHIHIAFVALSILFVGTASFGLGRLSMGQQFIPTLEFSEAYAGAAAAPAVSNLANSLADVQEGEVVASKNSTKYHYPWCSGAKSISPKNLITFSSIEEARAAGYTPAANCKGLE
ncbi:MAG: hypothetical protein KAR00_00890 [Candidatus Pacebacteria bacterium]|nr:hypothetical protein [Candidatus Paceibacterota bacterium]